MTGLAAGAASFFFAYEEAQEFQDGSLRKIAAVADISRLRELGRDGDVDKGSDPDPEDRVWVMRLPAARGSTASWLPDNLSPGLHTLNSPDGGWRIFVLPAGGPGTRIAVAQETAVRDEMAINSALRTLVPLLALIPLLAWLTVRIVRAELAPVRRLAQILDAQPAERPAAVSDRDLPDEITPFVRSINRLLERVSRLVGEQRRFIADAAHELRSPLTALSLQAQNLDRAESTEALRERIVPLKAGIERARRLAEQLLTLARGQAVAPTNMAVDVSRLARDLIAECLPAAEAREISLGMEAIDALTLNTDPQTLRLVLKNALDNALRYTPPQGEVTLRLCLEKEEAVMEIIDSGPGIPAAERERVFEPFHRLDAAYGEGSGLGLAIARQAASRLGGVISLHDRPNGSGLVFHYRQRCTP